ALSGWLIGGILYDQARADAPRFFFNRITRIWIPYAVAIALLYGAALLKRPADFHWFEYLVHDTTFTHNLFLTPRDDVIHDDLPLEGAGNHFWSLAVEEQFYLVAPLIILFAPFGRSLRLWTALAATAWIAGDYASIAFGVLAAFTQKRFGDWRLSPVAQIATGAALLASGVAVLGFDWRFNQTAPIFAVSAVLLLARAGPKSRIGAWLGGVSYPFYLNHWIGLYAAHAVARVGLLPEAGRPVASLLIGFAVSAALYRLVDITVRERKAAFYSARVGRLSVALAYGSIGFGVLFGLSLAALR
ncbi:MAG: acyltransferase, partial [Parvularculaceae bacterium]|nr:acyltransferase [Parvularculaceae bacterium]